jgi:hypothetical protein
LSSFLRGPAIFPREGSGSLHCAACSASHQCSGTRVRKRRVGTDRSLQSTGGRSVLLPHPTRLGFLHPEVPSDRVGGKLSIPTLAAGQSPGRGGQRQGNPTSMAMWPVPDSVMITSSCLLCCCSDLGFGEFPAVLLCVLQTVFTALKSSALPVHSLPLPASPGTH